MPRPIDINIDPNVYINPNLDQDSKTRPGTTFDFDLGTNELPDVDAGSVSDSGWKVPTWSPESGSASPSSDYYSQQQEAARQAAQQAAAAEAAAAEAAKASADIGRRRDDEQKRLLSGFDKLVAKQEKPLADQQVFKSSGIQADRTMPAMPASNVSAVDETPASRDDGAGELLTPFYQLSVDVLDTSRASAQNEAEGVEYEKDKQERIKRTRYDKASHDAYDTDLLLSMAVDDDQADKMKSIVLPSGYRGGRENNSPDDKPLAFRTILKDAIGRVTRGFRNTQSNRRSSSQKNYVARRYSEDFKGRLRGNGFFAQMVQAPNRDLRLHQVGVGWREVVAIVEQAPQMFESLLRESGCEFDTIVPELGNEVDIDKIIRIVNGAENGVWVAVSKSPEVDIQDVERMQLVILKDQERGLAFHPIIAPLYNADFDGDQAFVFLYKGIADMARSTMDYIVNWEGGTNVSEDWIPSVGLASGTNVKEFVRQNVFNEWSNGRYDIDGIVDAMADILENEFVDSGEKMSMWVSLFRAARDMAGNDDMLMSRVVQSAYEFVRNQASDDVIHTSGSPVDSFARPKTDADWLLLDVIEYHMNAQLPNNWQAFRSLFHSFPGNIKGKNPPFRFTADVGRSFAIDDRVRLLLKSLPKTEDGDYEVISDDDWRNFHKITAKYIASRKMAVEKEADERWQASRDAFRSRVVRRIAQLADPKNMDLYARDVDLSKGYPGKNGFDFDFIELFVRAYNLEASNANQANARFSDRYQHVEWGDQPLIKVDENGLPIDFSELSEPILSVYPHLKMENVFPAIGRRNSDPRWEGNPDHIDSKNLHSYENEAGVIGEKSRNRVPFYWILDRYDTWSLLKFSRNNRVVWSQSRVAEDVATKYSEVRKSGRRSELQYRLMLAIADKRTSAASTFQQSLVGSYNPKTRQVTHGGPLRYYDATSYMHSGPEVKKYRSGERLKSPYGKTAMDKLADLLCELVELDDKGIEDRAVEMEAIVFVVTELFPDMAHYFDMDTVEGLADSGYGRILIEHARKAMDRHATMADRNKLVDHVASTWLSMVFDYEMDSVYRKTSVLATAETAEEVAESTNSLAFSWQRLASKSEVWEGIVKEIHSGGEGWKALHAMAVDGTGRLLYPEFWKEHESGDIVDVIQDTDLLFGQKVDIITDIVRYQTNNPWINTFEVPFGMRIADNQLYSLNSANRKSAMGDITDFSDAYSSYAKTSRYNMHREVMEAKKRFGKSRGRLLRTVRNFDRMPWFIRSLSDQHYSSAIVAVLDKTTHQQEKGSQAHESNFMYQGMTTRHTDGAFSDLYQTDGRVLGVMSVENVGILDFIGLLANPERTIAVYNRRGAISLVNASSLLFGEPNHDMSDDVEVEKALWKFMEKNPRIASMLRLHDICSSPDGGAWVGTSKNGSISAAIEFLGDENDRYNPIDHANYLLEIHPGLASVLTLCDPIGNRTSRQYQASFEKTKRYFMYRLCQDAMDARDSSRNPSVTEDDVADLAVDLLGEFGVTEANMVKSNRSQYLERLGDLGLVNVDASGMAIGDDYENDQESVREAKELYDIACRYVTNYMIEVANSVDFSFWPGSEGYEPPSDLGSRSVSRESFSAFIDVNQELGASKTAMSTAVNGMTTFNHVEWVRFIDAQDRYVDLEWIMTCAEGDQRYLLGFDGAATSVIDADGNFVPFEATIDDDGNVVTNYDTLRQLDDGEIVIAGNGMRLRDKSTRKDGRVMPALFKQMDSKRSKGSEMLNLKLKKFGLDVLDSIIKMGSKHRTDMSYLEILQLMNRLYEESGKNVMAVHLGLGHQLYDAAVELGYKDLSLSDFTCIASLMTIVGEDGAVYVRSIEQLSNAVRYETSRLDHQPSPDEMQELVKRIVEDNSFSRGIGIMTFDARETFDEWRPAKKGSSILPTRHVSSNETRNHEMLDRIEKDQFDPTKPVFTEADARKLLDRILHEAKTIRKSGQPAKTIYGITNLKSVFDRCRLGLARDYIPIGGIGARRIGAKVSKREGAYEKAEPMATLPKNAIGPRYAYIVGDGSVSQREFDRAVAMCYKRGITMIVSRSHVDKLRNCLAIGDISLEKGLVEDSMEASDKGDVIVPFFDMRLNGAESMPVHGNGAMYTVRSYDMYTTSFESRSKELGDAEVKVYSHFANRIGLVQEEDMLIDDNDLFRITYSNPAYRRFSKVVREATSEEVEHWIVNSEELPTLDLGVNESESAEAKQYIHDVAWAFERYRDRWILLDGNVTDTVSTDLRPGDIVSWQVCEITDPDTGNKEYVFAPIIPFQLHGSVSVPPVYSISGMTHDNGVIGLHWKNESSALGNTIKSIDPMSGASKGVGYVPTGEYADPDDDRVVLKTGTPIDLSMEEAATSSRKEGTDKRLKTLVTFMIEARKLGYNFGNIEGSFPGHPEIAERLGLGSYVVDVEEDAEGNQLKRHVGRITREEWDELLADPDFRFSNDQRINRFLRVESSKFRDAGWNPSDFMSNLLDYGDGRGIRNSGLMWEFETTLDPRLDYEDDLLHFFHTMNSQLCPDGIDDITEDHYFRMWRNDRTGDATGYDRGQVQMELPVKDSSGNWYWLWHNVYEGRGFLAKQTTMLGRPNVTTAKFNPSAAHAMSYTHFGLTFDKRMESAMLNWALSGMRSDWARRGGTSEAVVADDAGEVIDTSVAPSVDAPATNATVPNIKVEDVPDMTSEPVAVQDVDVPVRNISPSRKAGNYSPTLDEAYRRWKSEQDAGRGTDEERIDRAKENFVNSSIDPTATISDQLGVTWEDVIAFQGIAIEDIASYFGATDDDVTKHVDPDIMQSIEDYFSNVDSDPFVDEVKERIARLAALKRRYGSIPSTGFMYDVDFDNYDFSGKPVVSPIHNDVVNGLVSDEVRNSYIFEVERRMAEDGGYLDDFLSYWSGDSMEDKIGRQISGYDDLVRFLNGLRDSGVRSTVADIMKVEDDAMKYRRLKTREELKYRRDEIPGLPFRTYEYTIAYASDNGPLDKLKGIRDDLSAAIKVARAEGNDVQNITYGTLLELMERCDSKVDLALEYPRTEQMKDLAKIRKLVKKGKLSGKSRAKASLIGVIEQIESTVVEIEDLKHEAKRILDRDIIANETERVRQEFAKRRSEEKRSRIENEAESATGWQRVGAGKSDEAETWSVKRRVEKAVTPRLERSLRNLRNVLLGDGSNDLEREHARMGMAFIETVMNPLKINVSGFHAETRTRTVTNSKGKSRTVKESRPSWGIENDHYLDQAQEYLGTGGGRLRVARAAMHRMALGIAADGTISHVSADEFEVSSKQFREVLKDVMAYCSRGMSPAALSDDVRGDPRSNRDSSGKFVVIGGTKRYPVFLSLNLWEEICADPTSAFYVEGMDPKVVARERFEEDVEMWRQNVHNAVALEGDLDQLAAIDGIARAVLSMSDGVSDISLPQIEASFSLDALEADALRSDDPDMYIPLEYMRNELGEGMAREARRAKHRPANEGRLMGFIRKRNMLRKASGSARISIMMSGVVEEAENILRGNIANALSNVAEYEGELMSGSGSLKLHDPRFDYTNEEYRNITSSRSWTENYRVVGALSRIGGEDLIDLYLGEKDPDTGRYLNTKFTEAELNAFLIRNGYISAPNSGKSVVDKAKNVAAETAAMAERLMTDFATSENIPGFGVAEAQLFAKGYMTDARVLYGDLARHEARGEDGYAYAVDVADAIAMAHTQGTGALMRKMMSTQTGREALMSMGFYGAGRKNFASGMMNRLMWHNGLTELLISTCINSYPCYGIGKEMVSMPFSSTACYLITSAYGGIGDLLALAGESRDIKSLAKVGKAMGRSRRYQMGSRSASLMADVDPNGNRFARQRRISLVGLRKNLIYDAVTAGSTVGKVLVTMQIIRSMGGLTPPKDPDNRLLYEEWRIGGEDGIPFKLAWWMDDLTGISIPVAMGLLINEGGSWEFKDDDGNVVAVIDGGEMAPKVIENGIASMNDGTFVFEAIELFTHWDEHWRDALGMDALDNIGNDDGIAAPSNRYDWFVTTTRNVLLDQLGQLTPAVVNEVMRTSQDYMFAGDRDETSPYLQWNTKGGTISVDEAKKNDYVTGIDDWHEVTLREITRKYWVLGQMMDILNWGLDLGSDTGYTWAEMPGAERIDKYAYSTWNRFSFDFDDIPKEDREGFLVEQGQAVYDHILGNYGSVDDAIADGFYLSHDALANARAYCKSMRNQLELARDNAKASIVGIGSSYNEIKAKLDEEIQRQEANITKVDDILWDSDFPSAIPKYKQQTTSYSTRYVDSNGEPSTYTQYLLGNATKVPYAYGDVTNPFTPITQPRQEDKAWNYESMPWNITGDRDVDDGTVKRMWQDLVEDGLTYERRDGTVEELDKTYFGGTSSPDGLMLSMEDTPTTGSRIDIPKVSSLPSYLRSKADLDDYYKSATGIEFGDLDVLGTSTRNDGTVNDNDVPTSFAGDMTSGNGITGNARIDAILDEYGVTGERSGSGNGNRGGNGGGYSYGTSRYSSGYSGSGGSYSSSYNPKIYSSSHQVYSDRASGLSTRSPYKATGTYLRPSFYTSGSRKSYLRMN